MNELDKYEQVTMRTLPYYSIQPGKDKTKQRYLPGEEKDFYEIKIQKIDKEDKKYAYVEIPYDMVEGGAWKNLKIILSSDINTDKSIVITNQTIFQKERGFEKTCEIGYWYFFNQEDKFSNPNSHLVLSELTQSGEYSITFSNDAKLPITLMINDEEEVVFSNYKTVYNNYPINSLRIEANKGNPTITFSKVINRIPRSEKEKVIIENQTKNQKILWKNYEINPKENLKISIKSGQESVEKNYNEEDDTNYFYVFPPQYYVTNNGLLETNFKDFEYLSDNLENNFVWEYQYYDINSGQKTQNFSDNLYSRFSLFTSKINIGEVKEKIVKISNNDRYGKLFYFINENKYFINHQGESLMDRALYLPGDTTMFFKINNNNNFEIESIEPYQVFDEEIDYINDKTLEEPENFERLPLVEKIINLDFDHQLFYNEEENKYYLGEKEAIFINSMSSWDTKLTEIQQQFKAGYKIFIPEAQDIREEKYIWAPMVKYILNQDVSIANAEGEIILRDDLNLAFFEYYSYNRYMDSFIPKQVFIDNNTNFKIIYKNNEVLPKRQFNGYYSQDYYFSFKNNTNLIEKPLEQYVFSLEEYEERKDINNEIAQVKLNKINNGIIENKKLWTMGGSWNLNLNNKEYNSRDYVFEIVFSQEDFPIYYYDSVIYKNFNDIINQQFTNHLKEINLINESERPVYLYLNQNNGIKFHFQSNEEIILSSFLNQYFSQNLIIPPKSAIIFQNQSIGNGSFSLVNFYLQEKTGMDNENKIYILPEGEIELVKELKDYVETEEAYVFEARPYCSFLDSVGSFKGMWLSHFTEYFTISNIVLSNLNINKKFYINLVDKILNPYGFYKSGKIILENNSQYPIYLKNVIQQNKPSTYLIESNSYVIGYIDRYENRDDDGNINYQEGIIIENYFFNTLSIKPKCFTETQYYFNEKNIRTEIDFCAFSVYYNNGTQEFNNNYITKYISSYWSATNIELEVLPEELNAVFDQKQTLGEQHYYYVLPNYKNEDGTQYFPPKVNITNKTADFLVLHLGGISVKEDIFIPKGCNIKLKFNQILQKYELMENPNQLNFEYKNIIDDIIQPRRINVSNNKFFHSLTIDLDELDEVEILELDSDNGQVVRKIIAKVLTLNDYFFWGEIFLNIIGEGNNLKTNSNLFIRSQYQSYDYNHNWVGRNCLINFFNNTKNNLTIFQRDSYFGYNAFDARPLAYLPSQSSAYVSFFSISPGSQLFNQEEIKYYKNYYIYQLEQTFLLDEIECYNLAKEIRQVKEEVQYSNAEVEISKTEEFKEGVSPILYILPNCEKVKQNKILIAFLFSYLYVDKKAYDYQSIIFNPNYNKFIYIVIPEADWTFTDEITDNYFRANKDFNLINRIIEIPPRKGIYFKVEKGKNNMALLENSYFATNKEKEFLISLKEKIKESKINWDDLRIYNITIRNSNQFTEKTIEIIYKNEEKSSITIMPDGTFEIKDFDIEIEDILIPSKSVGLECSLRGIEVILKEENNNA